MTADERFERVRLLFTEAAARAPEARPDWLAAQCQGEPELQREVQDLLQRAQSGRWNTAEGAVSELTVLMRAGAGGPLPHKIGGYEIVREIGSGGMGVVYEAQQTQPHRRVALKLLRREAFASESARRRFEFEAELLGRLQHPGIAQIFEAGLARTPEGPQPFLAMELVEGCTLDAWSTSERPPLSRKLELFVELCSAVQHAHERGVVHRDLKPENVLVDRNGRVRVLDFGIARVVGGEKRFTEAGAIVGTLSYMSPEHLWDNTDVVDTRSDVYSLGVLLYELVSGRLPHDMAGLSLGKALETVRVSSPRKLIVADGEPNTDLSWIVEKAMHRDREQRYGTAAALGEDVARLLRHDPITARPPSTVYQVRCFARRHRALVASGLLVTLVLAVGLVTTLAQARVAKEQTKNARDISDLYRSLFTSVDPGESGRDVKFIDVLDQFQAHVESDFGTRPLVQAAAFDTLANTYEALGELPHAEQVARSALETRRKLLGEHDPDTAESRHTLASVLFDTARLEEAEELYRTAHDDLLHAGTEYETNVLVYAHDLAHCWIAQGKLADGERLLRSTLDRQRTLFSPEDENVLTSENTLGNLLVELGRTEEALALQEEVLRARQSNLQPDNALVLTSINSVAFANFSLGKWSRAEELWRDLLARRTKALGPADRETINILNSLAAACCFQGKFSEAEQWAHRAIEGYESTLGAGNRETLSARNTLASTLRHEGKPKEALAILNEILERASTQLPASDPFVEPWRLNAARCHGDLGEWDAAEALLALCTDAVGLQRTELVTAIDEMSETLTKNGDEARAARLRALVH